MLLWRSLAEVRRSLPHVVLTIGNFDGLHLGHRRILDAVRRSASENRGTSLVMTFDPHPVRVLAPGRNLRLLTPLDERLALLEAAGLDAVLVLPFTPELSHLPPGEFLRRVVVEAAQAREVFVGGNFRFGYRHAGNVDMLWELGEKLGFKVEVVQPVQERGGVVSSTGIRNLIVQGQVGLAARLLGRCYAVKGHVVPGRGIGRRQTVPTLNLAPYPELLPRRGVYITETECGGPRRPSVTNIGYNPTFGETEFHLESHLLDAPPEESVIPDGVEMRVHFHHRIRDEVKFPSAEALRERIRRDIAAARRYFRRLRRIRPSIPT